MNFHQTQGKLKISGFLKIKEFINSVSALQGMLIELLQAEKNDGNLDLHKRMKNTFVTMWVIPKHLFS